MLQFYKFSTDTEECLMKPHNIFKSINYIPNDAISINTILKHNPHLYYTFQFFSVLQYVIFTE